MEFRSINDLNKLIQKNLYKFQNIDLIVGVPRSGMLPANLLALYLNKPLTDVDSFLEDKIYSHGYRLENTNYKNVLIVDDSINSGRELSNTKLKLKDKSKTFNLISCAIFAKSHNKNLIDIYLEIVDGSRVFEWNVLQHPILEKSCVDIDGVLCYDPSPEENDDGEKYHKFLLTAKPKFIPTIKIKTLISCRLEKYRNETMFWLQKHNIKYDNLILLNLPNAVERRKWNKYGEYKGNEYKKPEYVFFIESSLNEAKKIKEVSNKSVFCIETMSIV